MKISVLLFLTISHLSFKILAQSRYQNSSCGNLFIRKSSNNLQSLDKTLNPNGKLSTIYIEPPKRIPNKPSINDLIHEHGFPIKQKEDTSLYHKIATSLKKGELKLDESFVPYLVETKLYDNFVNKLISISRLRLDQYSNNRVERRKEGLILVLETKKPLKKPTESSPLEINLELTASKIAEKALDNGFEDMINFLESKEGILFTKQIQMFANLVGTHEALEYFAPPTLSQIAFNRLIEYVLNRKIVDLRKPVSMFIRTRKEIHLSQNTSLNEQIKAYGGVPISSQNINLYNRIKKELKSGTLELDSIFLQELFKKTFYKRHVTNLIYAAKKYFDSNFNNMEPETQKEKERIAKQLLWIFNNEGNEALESYLKTVYFSNEGVKEIKSLMFPSNIKGERVNSLVNGKRTTIIKRKKSR